MIQHVVYKEYMEWKYAIMKDGDFLDIVGTIGLWWGPIFSGWSYNTDDTIQD
jgi:hypothetical protein